MKNKKVISGVGAVVVVVLVFLGGILTGTHYVAPQMEKKAEDAAKAQATLFVKDLTTDKINDAYAMTTSSLQTAQAKDVFSKQMTNLKGDNPQYEAAQVLHQGDTIIYQQRVGNLPPSATGSTVGTFSVSLVKEKSTWKVSAVTVQ